MTIVTPLRMKQIKFTVKLLIVALIIGTLISILAEMFIYNISAKAVEYMFQDVSFQ